jgi:hypothetical protein
MDKVRSILRDLALVTYIVAGVMLCILLYKGLGIVSGVNTALTTVNQQCAPGPCGTLALVNKTVTKTGDAIVTTQIQEQAIGKKVGATMDALGSIPGHVNTALDGLTQTEGTATQTLQTLSNDTTRSLNGLDLAVSDTDTVIKGFVPTQTALQKSIHDFDDLITNPAINQTLGNVQVVTSELGTTVATSNHMLDTADKVETKATYHYLNPSKNPFVRTFYAVEPFFLPSATIAGALIAH